jgi:hypothetical protein
MKLSSKSKKPAGAKDEDSLNSDSEDGGGKHRLSGAVMELSKFQRSILKKDDRYTRLSGLREEATEEFHNHFEEFDEVVDASLRMYMSEAFKGVIQPKIHHHPN